MTPLTAILMLLWVAGGIGFIFAGWTARSLVGQRWLPHLAFLQVVGIPILFGMIVNAIPIRFGEADGWWEGYLRISGALLEFSRYAVLALILYLIARALPPAADEDRRTETGTQPRD